MRCFAQIEEAGRSICRFILFDIKEFSKNHWVFQVFRILSSKASSFTPTMQGDYVLLKSVVKEFVETCALAKQTRQENFADQWGHFKEWICRILNSDLRCKCKHRIATETGRWSWMNLFRDLNLSLTWTYSKPTAVWRPAWNNWVYKIYDRVCSDQSVITLLSEG